MSILVKQHTPGKTGVAGPAAGRSAKAPIPISYLSFQGLTSTRYRDGLTIHAAAFAALYVRLAQLDFRLDTLSSPHYTFGWTFHFRSTSYPLVPTSNRRLSMVITQKTFSKAHPLAVP
jgi:hypothetical protein